MTDPNALAQTVSTLKQRYKDFASRTSFPDLTNRLSTTRNEVVTLPKAIKDIRNRGYAFRSYLENKADVLTRQWEETQRRVESVLREETTALRQELGRAEQMIENIEAQGRAANVAAQEKIVPMLENALNALGDRIDSLDSRLQSMVNTLENDIRKTSGQINEIKWFLDQKDEASFKFLETEALFLAAKAEWIAPDKDNPEGIIFLTDQRVIFEQKQKVGKKLGLFGGKEVQQVGWETPLRAMKEVKPENKGLFGGKDMLHFTLGEGAPYGKITVEVKGGVDCKFWSKQIERMVNGDIADERAIDPDPEIIEKLRSAPTECHICGATLPQIKEGQQEVSCPYCGATVKL